MSDESDPLPDFERALKWLEPIEGGWWPGGARDPNPTFRGVTQRTYAAYRKQIGAGLQTVHLMTDHEHDAIYWSEYWKPAGCEALRWPLSVVHFDSAVNHGLSTATKLLRRADGDPSRYIVARREFYKQIVLDHASLAPNAQGWANRMDRLAAFIGVDA